MNRVKPEIEAIIEQVHQGRTVVLAVHLSEPFFGPKDGHIKVPRPDEMIDERHAVLVVGHIGGSDRRREAFIIRNSWGDAWGVGGYGYLPLEYVAKHATEAAVVVG
jgi:C1A family cysteine protease